MRVTRPAQVKEQCAGKTESVSDTSARLQGGFITNFARIHPFHQRILGCAA